MITKEINADASTEVRLNDSTGIDGQRGLSKIPSSARTSGTRHPGANGASTSVPAELDEQVGIEAQCVFQAHRSMHFEDGRENAFRDAIEGLVRRYGTTAVNAISKLLLVDKPMERGVVTTETAVECLRLLGEIEDRRSATERLLLLVRCLNSPHASFRDAAALGLLELGDNEAVNYLRNATSKETNPIVKKNILAVVDEFETK
ncbi:MAG: HEAT repeat domain-containing protein [Planctomycetaceae bacterium]|nr:HEAT repeat domain-containing protein [Planctomycetaceae bacterium]